MTSSGTPNTELLDTLEKLNLDTSEMGALGQTRLSDNSIARRVAQRDKRDLLFVRISFKTIRQTIPDPASRAVLVAKAFMDMEGTNECVLAKRIWECAGIETHDQRRRVLARLRKQGPALKVVDRPGRPSVLVTT